MFVKQEILVHVVHTVLYGIIATNKYLTHICIIQFPAQAIEV